MTAREKTRWKAWAEELRQEMMTQLRPEITKSVEAIIEESHTELSVSLLATPRFWKSCQAGKGPNDVLVRAGFEISFSEDDNGSVELVKLQLNATWKGIMQQVLDRKKSGNVSGV